MKLKMLIIFFLVGFLLGGTNTFALSIGIYNSDDIGNLNILEDETKI